MPDASQVHHHRQRTKRGVPGQLNVRERGVLQVLVQMHAEFGIGQRFTGAAVEHIAGACAGSLAGLVMYGYVKQQGGLVDGVEGAGHDPERAVVYSVTERGYALFAGIEGQV